MNAMTSKFLAATNAPVTPGGYMRECRKRAGLTIKQVSEAIAIREDDRLQARWDLTKLERNRPGDYGRLVKTLRDRAVFPFDFGIFVTLAAETADYTLGDVE